MIPIVPKKYAEELGEAGFANKPVGTGLFKLKENVVNDRVTLEAFPESWRGGPRVQEVTFRLMGDVASRVSALRAGDIQLAQNLPPDQAEALKTGGFPIHWELLGQALGYALDPNCDCPTKDKRVRQAMNYAVNKEAIVRTLFKGYTKPAQGQILTDNGFGFNPSLQPYPYDPAKAKQLLAEAGHAKGFSVKMQITAGRNVLDKELGEVVKQQLGDVGINAEIELLENNTYLDRFYKGGRAPIFQSAWSYHPAMDADFAFVWFQSTQPKELLRYNSTEFDKLYKAAQSELDTAKREKLLQDAAAIMREDPPELYLFGLPQIYAASKNIAGFEARPDGAMWLGTLAVQ